MSLSGNCVRKQGRPAATQRGDVRLFLPHEKCFFCSPENLITSPFNLTRRNFEYQVKRREAGFKTTWFDSWHDDVQVFVCDRWEDKEKGANRMQAGRVVTSLQEQNEISGELKLKGKKAQSCQKYRMWRQELKSLRTFIVDTQSTNDTSTHWVRSFFHTVESRKGNSKYQPHMGLIFNRLNQFKSQSTLHYALLPAATASTYQLPGGLTAFNHISQ